SHPYPPPFPTRRSSDLWVCLRARALASPATPRQSALADALERRVTHRFHGKQRGDECGTGTRGRRPRIGCGRVAVSLAFLVKRLGELSTGHRAGRFASVVERATQSLSLRAEALPRSFS